MINNQQGQLQQSSKKISEPKKFLKQNSYTHELDGTEITYFLAEKENNSGIMNNERFFVLVGDQFFAYVRKLEDNVLIPFNSIDQIPMYKVKILLQDIKQVTTKGNNLTIKFNGIQKEKIVQKKWVIKLHSTKMMDKIQGKLEQAINKRKSEIRLRNKKLSMSPRPQLQYRFANQEKKQLPPKLTEYNDVQIQGDDFFLQNQKKVEQIQVQTDFKHNSSQDFEIQIVNELNKNINNTQPIQNSKKIEKIQPLQFISLKQQKQNQIVQSKQLFIKRQKQLIENSEFGQKSKLNNKKSNVNFNMDLPEYEEQKSRDKILNNQNQEWNYEFLKSDQYRVVEDFKTFCEVVIIKIIDQLSLPESKRYYRPVKSTQTEWTYQVIGLVIRLCFSNLKQIKLLQNTREIVYNESAMKSTRNQFKNMNYLLNSTRNKGKIRVPLAMLIQYKGILAFIKAPVIQDTNNNKLNISNELDLISRETKIQKLIFQHEDFVQIIPLLGKTYSKLARQDSQNSNKPKDFEIYYLDNVKHFLPQDFLFIEKDPENKNLRPEFIQKEEYSDIIFCGENVLPYLNRTKMDRLIQQSIAQLAETSKDVLKYVNQLIEDWQNLQINPISSIEIQQTLHEYGINMRYLGLIYQQLKTSIFKRICMAQIVARVAKSILRINLQQQLKQANNNHIQIGNQQRNAFIYKSNQQLLEIAIEFLNSVVSETSQSASVWKAINKQALYAFNVSVNKDEIAEGHFIKALIYHCNLNILWDKFDRKFLLFRAKSIFKRQMFKGFAIKSKPYDLSFTDLYMRVRALIGQQSEQNIEQLKSLLNLRKFNIPTHFRMSNIYYKLCEYLAAYIRPRIDNNSLPCSSLYQLLDQQPLSLSSTRIAILEIKWGLRDGRVENSLKLYKSLIEKIQSWCGNVHPILTEMFSLLAQYYLNQGQFQQAINYAKSGLGNVTKIVGTSHLKTAESYFQLADIYFKSSRRQQALATFKKAKIIFENQNKIQMMAYAEISHKVGLLQLFLGKLKQAEESILKATGVYEKFNQQFRFENEITECYQVLARIHEISGNVEQYNHISQYCQNQLPNISNPQNLEKVLKIIILPLLSGLTVNQTQLLKALLLTIPLQNNSSSYTLAYTFIKKLISKGDFCQSLNQYFHNFEQIYTIVLNNAVITRWRGLQSDITTAGQEFVGILQSLIYLLSEGFVFGTLID